MNQYKNYFYKLNFLAKRCRVNIKDISYAGTKDSKAEIIQNFSVKNYNGELKEGENIGPKMKILEVTSIPRHIQAR